MKRIYVKKGWRFNIAGKPSALVEDRRKLNRVAAVPERIPFIKARPLVQVGDRVRVGSPLFEDKKRPELKFLSPGGGKVVDIRYGQRRVISAIVIEIDAEETFEPFDLLDAAAVARIDRKQLISRLLEGGLWPFLRELPFRSIADVGTTPPAIWVSPDVPEPFGPDAELFLNDRMPLFDMGIAILRRLSEQVHICRHADHADGQMPAQMITHRVYGPYPSSDPGVLVYQTKKTSRENRSWYIHAQDLVLMAQSLATGRYPVEKMVAVSEGEGATGRHVLTRIGAPLSRLVSRRLNIAEHRFFAGGIFAGAAVPADGFLGLYESSLALLPVKYESELMSFARPGWRKLSYSRAFLSVFNKQPKPVDSNFHGEHRACINCGYCTRVCPVDILPQFTYKCIYAEETEEALQHGLLDCVECGLCSFVCPSKIELAETLAAARRSYYEEQITS